MRPPSRRTAGDGTGVGGGTSAAGGGTSAAGVGGGAVSWSVSRLARGGCPAPDSGLARVAGTGVVGLGRGDTESTGWVGFSGSMGDGGMVVARGMTDGQLINGALAICGVYWRMCFLLRSVTRPDPSTRMAYWSYCRTSTTIPVRSHLVGCGPTRFCSLTQLPIMSGGRTRVCSDSRSCALMCRIRSASSLACSVSRHVQWGRYCPGGTGMKSRMRRPKMISAGLTFDIGSGVFL